MVSETDLLNACFSFHTFSTVSSSSLADAWRVICPFTPMSRARFTFVMVGFPEIIITFTCSLISFSLLITSFRVIPDRFDEIIHTACGQVRKESISESASGKDKIVPARSDCIRRCFIPLLRISEASAMYTVMEFMTILSIDFSFFKYTRLFQNINNYLIIDQKMITDTEQLS